MLFMNAYKHAYCYAPKMTQQIFRKLRLLSIAQEEPTKSQVVQRPKEEEPVHAKPMTRQCAGD